MIIVMNNLKNNNEYIKTIVIEVNEEIKKNHIKEFIYTSLSLQNIKIDKKDYLLYIYISEIKSYEIVIYKNRFNKLLLLNGYFQKNPSLNTTLLVCDNLIVLFKDKKLFYIHKLEYNLSQDELKEFIYNRFSIVVDDFRFLEYDELKKIKFHKNQLFAKLNFITKNNYIYTSLYITYLLILFLLISFIIYENNFSKSKLEDDIKQKQTHLMNLINSKQKSLQVVSLVEIFKNIKLFSLDLRKLTYEQKNYFLILENTDEKELYKFVNIYKKNTKIKKLQYVSERGKYELHIQISNY